MTFRIHYNGDYEDSIIIEGETIDEIQEEAFYECDRRGWDKTKCWSEMLGR